MGVGVVYGVWIAAVCWVGDVASVWGWHAWVVFTNILGVYRECAYWLVEWGALCVGGEACCVVKSSCKS